MIKVEELRGGPIWEEAVEAVERKGLGHPDTICDSVCEAVSVALSREYKRLAGAVLHHNIDKGLLAAGRAAKGWGGGRVLKAMRLFIGDRATRLVAGRRVDVAGIAVETAREWLKNHIRFLDPTRHVRYSPVLAPGSAQLTGIYLKKDGGLMGANDTSAAFGYWPLSRTERAVLELEGFLNSKGFKERFPETGEDVKVMGLRQGGSLGLTVAMPLLDRFIRSEADYFVRKEMVMEEISRFLAGLRGVSVFDDVTLCLNNLDEKAKGMRGVYLSVTGTSAEDADSGQVGRGNRVNGLISFGRPMSTEAAAGKNPVSHVGKIYNVLAHRLARKIYEKAGGAALDVYVLLVSRIGVKINTPLVASAKLRLAAGVRLEDVSEKASGVIEEGLSEKSLLLLTGELSEGMHRVC